ncbi:testis-specific serine/threonine-protein kinase 3-like [Amphiura filiformis]|uniref:testis-specific serine/threonine-protein kinase 3-like n=1 Tax=Amphiura filiformis TaxID=82378 RepID=UPI003B21678A
MELDCDGSVSHASSVASSRQSSASSQRSVRSESGRTKSAITNAYGALRRLVTRKASNKRTDSPHLPVDCGSELHENESCTKRQEPTLLESLHSTDHEQVAKGSQATSDDRSQKQKRDEKTERRPKTAKKTTKTVKDMPKPSIPKPHAHKPEPLKARGTKGQDAYADALHEAAKSGSDGEILAAKGIIIKRKLGEGTYAKVRSGFHTRLQRPSYVAVKIISRAKTNERYQRKFLPRELGVLRQIRHKNIIRLIDCFEHGPKVFMVMELANYGDLLEYIQRKRILPNDRARYIFTQILDGLEYLHHKGIFHRDLKCENILLNVGYKIKITDFGFAREWSDAHNLCRTFCGSAAYASPEILRGIPYDPHVADIWSMGVILFIMVTGTMPYDDSDVKKMLNIMAQNRLDFPRKRTVCYEVKVLLHSILYYCYRDRATLSKIRHSPWMQGQCTMPPSEDPAGSSSTMLTPGSDPEGKKTPVAAPMNTTGPGQNQMVAQMDPNVPGTSSLAPS